MTSEQLRTIHTIACLTLLNAGRAPALGELAAALAITKQSAADRLHWLEKKSLWRRADGAITALGLRSALGLPEP